MKYLLSLVFFITISFYTLSLGLDPYYSMVILFASLAGGYMAMNIWANDVANSVWPAVGSKTITLKWAIIIAAIWNFSGALIAWWDVVSTIKDWIIDISGFGWDTHMFIFSMISALVAAAIWLNIATYFKAPVSTTHSIVWGVMWAWIAALWVNVVSWSTMWKIVASWIISPVLWGIIAAIFLYFIKTTIIFKDDKIKSAQKMVPIFVAIMSWAFSTYLILKWLKHLIKLDFTQASIIWFIIAIIVYFVMSKVLKWKNHKIKNNRESINTLFSIPLIFAVALLTFAHWANDVANAIWPLAWIYDAIVSWWITWKASIPIWIMVIWWAGISIWLYLFWPRIIKRVWWEITELDQVRAFSIALSAALTVIIASQLWLPVSSTHIALGWIFWVWFLREYLDKKHNKKKEIHVKRDLIYKIIAAWLITVPVVAFLSGMVFLLIESLYL